MDTASDLLVTASFAASGDWTWFTFAAVDLGVAGLFGMLSVLLVIDDGSTDGTGDAARTAGAEVRRHERNRGKGAGLQTAFEILLEREYDGVVTLDADGQHLPGEVHNLLAAAEDGADMVLGTRAHLFDEMGTLRRISNRTSSCLISFLAGLPNWGAGTLKSELVPGTSSISCEPQRTIRANVQHSFRMNPAASCRIWRTASLGGSVRSVGFASTFTSSRTTIVGLSRSSNSRPNLAAP